ncbi:GvpL/GvpF family gas vesicle protein [Actinacidiphila acidipaludis]|uniref:GvpL/GvpF family gas vesicle protein n=1 Tax=Actinacidiphila acidipaludis TaxID=2873382 RepID=A0ABS7QGY8_9ACTN|nr:GvpL/GvpF family gas vesicle protein [Streptomyces acidipaludis]MBY8882228.1 GvpL/GvpF family gas vesicle protein [Streptomyces acidipaludis]
MNDLVWIYAVTTGPGPPEAAGLSGVAAEPVRAVEGEGGGEGLTAVVGTVPAADFAEDPLKDHLEDLRWLEAAARAHHEVIDTVFRHGDTVPLQFATVYRDDDSVRAVLRERSADFTGALARVHGQEEWGVKAYMDPGGGPEASGGPAPSGGPGGGAAGASGADSRPGTAYLLRRRAQRDDREQAFQRARGRAEDVRGVLESLATRGVAHPPQDPKLAAYQGWMILNDSFLVERDRAEEFAAAVTSCAEDFPEVELELSGPWPPYSFVGEVEGRRA